MYKAFRERKLPSRTKTCCNLEKFDLNTIQCKACRIPLSIRERGERNTSAALRSEEVIHCWTRWWLVSLFIPLPGDTVITWFCLFVRSFVRYARRDFSKTSSPICMIFDTLCSLCSEVYFQRAGPVQSVIAVHIAMIAAWWRLRSVSDFPSES